MRGVDAFVQRAAGAVSAGDVPDSMLAEGLAEVDPHEQRRVVGLWADRYADRWESLVTTAGDPEAAEQAVVTGALRVAIAERQRTPRELVEPFDDERLRPPPYAALAVVLPPQLVWSIDEARAGMAAARDRRRSSAELDAIQDVAFALMSFEHVRRTRSLAARLRRELPFHGLLRALAVLEETCSEVEAQLEGARRATAALLITYSQELAGGETER